MHETPMRIACKNGNSKIVHCFFYLNKNFDIDFNDSDTLGIEYIFNGEPLSLTINALRQKNPAINIASIDNFLD